MIYIGIDPGVSGAVAVIDGETVTLYDVPTRKGTRGEVYLAGKMADILRPYGKQSFAMLEEVSAPRGRIDQGELARVGVGSQRTAVKIGYGLGLWEMACAALYISYELTRPQAWKKEFRLTEGDKKASRARACELFPTYRDTLAKKRPDFSEALLLAEYGRRRVGR